MVVVVVVVAVVVVVVVLMLFLRGGGVRVVVVVGVGVDVVAIVVVAAVVVVVLVVVAVEVVAGGGHSPPPPFANTFITGSGFLKTSLHGIKETEGLGGGETNPHLQTRHLQTDCLYDDLKKRYDNYVFDAILVDGAIFLKASLHGVKQRGGFADPPPSFANTFITGSAFLKTSLHGEKTKKAGGLGGAQHPPICKHLYHLSRVLRGSIWVRSLLVRRYLKSACMVSKRSGAPLSRVLRGSIWVLSLLLG